ncbi:MAG: hypothetical protein NT069_21445, partial [Planctomycetota bacterium]|nr:hypothetical protein [Planctomycetota bacterium]
MFKVHSQWGRLVARALSVVLAASLLAAIVGVASAQNPAKPAPTRQDGDGANPPLKASPGLILSLSYSPDGELIASGGADGKVRLFDAGTGVEIRTILEHDGPAAGVAYSPNGELVLRGGRDGGYRQTSVEGSNRFGSLNSDNQEAVTSVASSPNGLSFATSSGDQISLWGPGVGVRHTLRGHADMVTSVAYSPDCS